MRSTPLSRCVRIVGLALALAATPTPATAVLRTCGGDPFANTANVLCAAPSGPCDATTVALSAAIEVTSGGCTFDLQGRALVVTQRFQMAGAGFIDIVGATDVTLSSTGRLEARGDFGPGAPTDGGRIAITGAGALVAAGVLDVSGNPRGGLIQLELTGGITLQPTSVVRGDATAADADGGFLTLISYAGNIDAGGTVSMNGGLRGRGGDVEIEAARNIATTQPMTARGGELDGGDVVLLAGDDVRVAELIDVSSTGDGGYGGRIDISAGADYPDSLLVGGTAVIQAPGRLLLNGSGGLVGGGDGGRVSIDAVGAIRLSGSGVRIQANAGSPDGFGGRVDLDTNDPAPTTLGPGDGDIVLEGAIEVNGPAPGFGGQLDLAVGRHLTIAAPLSANGGQEGGTIVAEAGGAIHVDGPIAARATGASGHPGVVELRAGLALDSALSVNATVDVRGGSASNQLGFVSLAGCSLTVAATAVVNGQAGMSPGGSTIELLARSPMQLAGGASFHAAPSGVIRTIHPVGQDACAPAGCPGVTFSPARVDVPDDGAAYPGCGIGGNGGGMIGPGGGTVSTPDGRVTVTVPPGTLTQPTTVSIAAGAPDSDFNVGSPATRVLVVELQPEGVVFDPPVTVTLRWPDTDGDGKVDGTNLNEQTLRVWRNGGPITHTCGNAACSGTPCVSASCDQTLNAWTLTVSQFSELVTAVEPCQPTPETGCRGVTAPRKAALALKRGSEERSDRFSWKWTKGADTPLSTFGAPTATDGYRLCVYDALGLRMSATVPAAGSCAGKACWTAQSTGYVYKNRALVPDGIALLQLKSGEAGKAKVRVNGKGTLLDLPALPLVNLPVTAQLVRDDRRECWTAVYSTATRNDSQRFTAKSD